MKKILLLSLTLIFAGELEVDGDLKVTGNVDVQNNPIKNVGPPTTLTDAINGNVLQDALRDDGPFEYKIYLTRIESDRDINVIGYYEYQNGVNGNNNSSEWNSNFHNEIFLLLNDNWKFDNIISIPGLGISNSEQSKNLFIFKRPIEDE